jgi:hypothetical protein
MGVLCIRCHEIKRKADKQHKKDAIALGLCANCRVVPKEKGILCNKCYDLMKETYKRTRLKTKKLVIDHYGGKCACCGETELSFLTLDHIDGGGRQHRIRLGGGKDFYQAMKRLGFPDGLQVLCANCHLSKTVLGQCIHRKDVENG